MGLGNKIDRKWCQLTPVLIVYIFLLDVLSTSHNTTIPATRVLMSGNEDRRNSPSSSEPIALEELSTDLSLPGQAGQGSNLGNSFAT